MGFEEEEGGSAQDQHSQSDKQSDKQGHSPDIFAKPQSGENEDLFEFGDDEISQKLKVHIRPDMTREEITEMKKKLLQEQMDKKVRVHVFPHANMLCY